MPNQLGDAPDARRAGVGSFVKYDAFISYNHAADGRLSPAVRDALHRFARPWYRLRALRVFCDLRSVAATEGLWPSIERALDGSRRMVLLASPESARSVWVRREVEYWQRIEPKRPILIGLTAGEIRWDDAAGDFDWERTTALPGSLRGWFAHEPLWVDLTDARRDEKRSLSDPEFLDRIATLSAALHDPPRDKDDLIGEDVRQYRRALRFRRFSWAGLSVLTVLALVAATVAFTQRSIALEQRDTALANQLVAEAGTVADTQPGLARQLIAAAHQLKPTPQVESAVIGSGVIPQEIHVEASAIAYSPDGRLFAVAGPGREAIPGHRKRTSHIWLYDAATMTVLSEWSLGTRQGTEALAFSPGAPLLAVAHSDDILLWDVADPREPVGKQALTGHRDTVKSLSFSADGQILASGGADERLRLWDTAAGEAVAEQRIDGGEHTLRFTVRFAASRRLLATVTGDATATLRLWDVNDPRVPRQVGKGVDGIREFDIASHGRRLVTGAERELRVWDVPPGAAPTSPRALPMPGGQASVMAVAYGAGDRIAAVTGDGLVRMWDVSGQPTLVAALVLPVWDSYNVDALAISPDGRSVAVATPGSNAGPNGAGVVDGTIRVWNVADARERRAVAALGGHDQEVTDFAVSQDGRFLATAGGFTVRLWDLADPMNPRPLASMETIDEVELTFGPNDSLAITGETAVRLLDISDPRAPREVGAWPAELVVALAFSGDGRHLAIGTINSAVALYDVTRPDRGRPIGEIPVPGWSLAFVPGQDAIVTAGGFSEDIELWDISDPARPRRSSVGSGHTYQVGSVSASADGNVFASSARDGTSRIWRIEDGSLVEQAVIADTGDVNTVAVSPGGRRLATLGRDRTLRVYELVSGTPEPTLIIHLGNTAATAISFVRDDKLAVATRYGTVDLWDLDISSALRRLCTGIGAPITEDQWRQLVPDVTYRQPC